MHQQEIIAAIATPPGAGGLAVIRLSGETALEVAARVFQPKNRNKSLNNTPGYSALFGRFIQNGQTIDTGVALVFRAPHSYTGEDVVELSCHGGEQVSAAVLAACLTNGAKPAAPGEFTKRAVLNDKMDLSQAEAVLGLIEATSAQGIRQANAAMEGALGRELETIRETLVNLAGHLAAYVDYPEEDVEELTTEALAATVRECEQKCNALMQNYGRGVAVRRGVQTAIVGSPNVGKSTLFNLLAGFERAIVTPVAGTTRDVLREHIRVGGILLHIADTAGLRASQDPVEGEGIRRAEKERDEAGLIIAVFDGTHPETEADIDLAKTCQGRPALAIINKNDLGTQFNPKSIEPYIPQVLHISAKDPACYGDIETAVLKVLHLHDFDPNAAALLSERQLNTCQRILDALQEARAAVETGFALDAAGVCIDDALAALAELRGDSYTEDVINNVFANFCVGK